MDRRQEKTRAAIFDALVGLLDEKEYGRITVREIIDRANVGRTTFYAHFDTKDDLLREMCEELFAHIFAAAKTGGHVHGGQAHAGDEAFLHVLYHVRENDRGIRTLLARDTTGTARRFFREGVWGIVSARLGDASVTSVPRDYLIGHLTSGFVATVLWWMHGGCALEPEQVARYHEAVTAPVVAAFKAESLL